MHSLYTDGSHASDLSIAGIGGYLLDNNDKEVWSFSNPLHDDQAHHELKALDYALVRCLDSGVKELTCYTDSLNIVRDIGKNQAKHTSDKYTNLFDNLLKLLPEFQTIKFKFIPREENKKANYLARKVLTNITSKQSRADIFQSMNSDFKYFKSDKLFCSEQFVDKKKINNIRNTIKDYYVFDLYRGNQDNTIDIYHVTLGTSIKVKKIYSYPINDIWPQYINAITQTLKQADNSTIGIMLCPANNIIDMMLRGMKPLDKKYSYELENLSNTIQSFKRILLDSDTLIYNEVFIKKE